MHRLGCWKERLLYSVPALVCAISLMNICVYLIAAVSFSVPLLYSEKVGGCKTILLIVVRRVNEFEWLYVHNVWKNANTTQCVSWMQSVFFCFLFFWSLHKWLRTRVWWSGTHGDSILHMTATRNNRWSVQACTQKWPLNIHTWPTFKCSPSF